MRKCLFLIIALFIIAGPAYKQVFNLSSKYLRPWVMFHGYGINICDVKFYELRGNYGSEIPRIQNLGYNSFLDAPRHVRRLKNISDIKRQAKILCHRLDIADLRARLRCGSRTGWKQLNWGDLNLCG